MTINKTVSAGVLSLALAGRLDTTTAPELEAELKASLDGVTELIFDLIDISVCNTVTAGV